MTLKRQTKSLTSVNPDASSRVYVHNNIMIIIRARRRTALIACELARYNIDIAALSETRIPDEGSLVEMGTGYTFFWSGLPTGARRIHGVGFAVRTALLQSTQESPIAIDERLMTLRLPLAKDALLTL